MPDRTIPLSTRYVALFSAVNHGYSPAPIVTASALRHADTNSNGQPTAWSIQHKRCRQAGLMDERIKIAPPPRVTRRLACAREANAGMRPDSAKSTEKPPCPTQHSPNRVLVEPSRAHSGTGIAALMRRYYPGLLARGERPSPASALVSPGRVPTISTAAATSLLACF